MKNFLFIGLILFSSACTRGPRPDDIVLRVNGSDVAASEYASLFESLKPKEYILTGRSKQEMRNLVIKSLIREAVIVSEAKQQNVNVTDKELNDAIEEMKSGHTSQSFQESLLDQMVNEDQWQKSIRQNLLVEKMFLAKNPGNPRISDQELYKFYEENAAMFRQPAQASALHIVVTDEAVAEKIHAILLASPQRFLELAKTHSVGPEAQNNGAKIVVDEGVLPEELDAVLFHEARHQVSKMIKSPHGFHFLKVIERKPPLNFDLEDVRPQIVAQLQGQKRREWLLKFEEELIRKAHIEYNRELIKQL